MSLPRTKESSSWCSKHTIPSTSNRFATIKLDTGLLAKRSSMIASLLEKNPNEDLSTVFKKIQPEPEALELIARFCHNFDVKMTSNNILSLICLSNNLKMTENHSPNNLLNNAILFLKEKILPSWDQIIRALRASSGLTFQQADEIGLFDLCVEALIAHVVSDPTLLAQPVMVEYTNNRNRPIVDTNNAIRRKLFDDADSSEASLIFDSTSLLEDLASLSVQMYEPIIEKMAQRQVPQENIAGSLYRYLRRNEANREAIEAIERQLSDSTYTTVKNTRYPLYSYTLLFEIYVAALSVEASLECIASLENRISKDLDRVTAEDLLALDLDFESLRRILKGYYSNFTDPYPTGLVAVAELMERYLLEVANKNETDMMGFIEVAEMASSASNVGSYRSSDGIYRAVDVFLEKHKELSELQREDVCRFLDFQKMSSEACKHAAMNRRLPLRVVVQVLFESQLQLKDNISKAVGEYGSNSNVEEEEGRKAVANVDIQVLEDEEWEKDEQIELEKKCCGKKGKKKVGLWKGMKRKFGCMGSSDYETLHDCNCQTTRKVKKNKKGV